jgi:selenocysteine lyase/cysteine desulfurase
MTAASLAFLTPMHTRAHAHAHAHVQAGVPAASLRASLLRCGINVSVSLLASTRIEFEERGLREVVRASVHYFNTTEEIDLFVAAVAAMPPL